MSSALDPLSLKYVLHAKSSRCKTLDIGCGDGLVTAAVIERGGQVVAMDCEPTFIEALRLRIPREAQARLVTKVGKLPHADFAAGCFAGIHAARVFGCLTGDEIELSLKKFYRWLQPEGKLFVSALSPSGSTWKSYVTEFHRRKASAVRWPGMINDVAAIATHCDPPPNGFLHLLDEAMLRRALESVGFIIEDVSSYVVPWDEQQTCAAVIGRRSA